MKNIFKWNKTILLLIIMGIVTISVICFKIYMIDSYDVKDVFNDEGGGLKISIIPKPMSYQGKEGKFILTKNSAIYIKGKNDEETEHIKWVAEFIREKLNASTGFDLQIIVSDKPVNGSIYLTTVNSNEELGNDLKNAKENQKEVKSALVAINENVGTLANNLGEIEAALSQAACDLKSIMDELEKAVPAQNARGASAPGKRRSTGQ